MDAKINYQKELDKVIAKLDGPKKLLLHSCCAPCSSYCMEYLRQYFEITVFYYNPNIMQKDEYLKRAEEQKRLIDEYNAIEQEGIFPISCVEGAYEVDRYLAAVKGLEQEPERGGRCTVCFRLRLTETARMAKKLGMDYFTTTLTISPMKNEQLINQLGMEIGREEGIAFLPSDFKKKGGYLRSIELSKQYGLYRQNYCGCDFSKPKETEK